MTPEEFEQKMRELVTGDIEVDHLKMDELMCELLKQLGYEKGVEIFEETGRWYA